MKNNNQTTFKTAIYVPNSYNVDSYLDFLYDSLIKDYESSIISMEKYYLSDNSLVVILEFTSQKDEDAFLDSYETLSDDYYDSSDDDEYPEDPIKTIINIPPSRTEDLEIEINKLLDNYSNSILYFTDYQLEDGTNLLVIEFDDQNDCDTFTYLCYEIIEHYTKDSIILERDSIDDFLGTYLDIAIKLNPLKEYLETHENLDFSYLSGEVLESFREFIEFIAFYELGKESYPNLRFDINLINKLIN